MIILDDASIDNSVEVINGLVHELKSDYKFITNKVNSGRACVQWLKGVEHTKGDYVWIAEADDSAEPEFLQEVIMPFNDPEVVLSYCQSKQMSSSGNIFSNDYLDYKSDISSNKWRDYYTNEGVDEIKNILAIKNTIPNVSSVIFDRDELIKVLQNNIDEIKKYRVAGDWIVYLLVLESGKISFSPKSLNLHRRHDESITLGSFNDSQLKEILSVQKRIRDNFHPDNETIEKAKLY